MFAECKFETLLFFLRVTEMVKQFEEIQYNAISFCAASGCLTHLPNAPYCLVYCITHWKVFAVLMSSCQILTDFI